MHRWAAGCTLVFAALALGGCEQASHAEPAGTLSPAAATTIVVVRHAEKAEADSDDPPLHAAGERRALALTDVVADAEISAIYSTQYRRTRATAEPLAERVGVPVHVRPIGRGEAEPYAAELAGEILRRHAGGSVVVVGHSNTVPQIVEALSGRAVRELTEQEYDHAYVVVVPADGAARLFRLRFGDPDPR